MPEYATRTVSGPAIPQQLLPVSFSSTTWLMIYAVLKNHQINGSMANTRQWAADHIMAEVLIASGLTEEVDDVRASNEA